MPTFEVRISGSNGRPNDCVFDRVIVIRNGQWPNLSTRLKCETLGKSDGIICVDPHGEGSMCVTVNDLPTAGNSFARMEIRTFVSDGHVLMVCAKTFEYDNSGVWDAESDHEETDSPDLTEEEEEGA